MKFVVVAIITAAVGFFAFQNCQKSPHANDIAGPTDSSAKNSVSKLSETKLSKIDFIFPETEQIEKAGQSYSLEVNKTLEIDLSNGRMVLKSDASQITETYCLTETLHQELLQILKSSEICKSAPAKEGQICTQVMKLPYAILHTEKETIELGSATDGCGSNSMDLCGEQAQHIQGFWAQVKPNIRSYKCP